MQKFDVIIVGGGMVGLSAALAIRHQRDLTIAVIDTQPVAEHGAAHDVRVSAINAASKQLFENIGVWSGIQTMRHQAYQSMHIWDSEGYGHIDFSLDDINERVHQGQLGWIIENNAIRYALSKKVQSDSKITVFSQEKLTNIAIGDSEVFATFTTLPPITAKLLIGADGARSWVREQVDIPLTFRDYDHHAIVATVKCPQGHDNTAWQVFLSTGPLAFLPLDSQDDDLCSIVWSTSPEEAERLLALDDSAFNKEISAASDGKLGVCEVISERFSFPLSMRFAQEFVSNRVVLMGDAAHTIHPLAGQGVNLGLLDAAALAELLVQQKDDIGATKVLNQYQRWRKSDAAEMIAAMEAIKQSFTPQNEPFKLLRGIGMSVLNNIKSAKSLMVKQALGLQGELPVMSRKSMRSD